PVWERRVVPFDVGADVELRTEPGVGKRVRVRASQVGQLELLASQLGDQRSPVDLLVAAQPVGFGEVLELFTDLRQAGRNGGSGEVTGKAVESMVPCPPGEAGREAEEAIDDLPLDIQPPPHAPESSKESSAGDVDVILVAQAGLPELYADLRHAGIKQAVRVPIAHGVAARLTASQVSFFASDPRVDRIIYDAPVQLSDTPFDPGALASLYPQVVDAAASWSNRPSPLTGNGIGIAVIDSGIAAHPDLAGRVVTSKDFNPNVNDASDTYGHGTAVAGIIAGDGTASGGAYVGIAPRASLINIRVNDGTGAAPTSAIMNALLWATVNRKTYNIRVINLSLQASVQASYQTSPLDAAVEYAWLKGILVVVAAGNKGPNSELYAPANDPYVITVGATDDRGTRTIADDTLAAFSSYGVTQDGFSKPDLVAPGRHIVTTLAAGSAFAVGYPGNLVGSRYIQLSGSSMAAPQVSGVAALYLEAHPSIGPSQLKGVLRATA